MLEECRCYFDGDYCQQAVEDELPLHFVSVSTHVTNPTRLNYIFEIDDIVQVMFSFFTRNA